MVLNDILAEWKVQMRGSNLPYILIPVLSPEKRQQAPDALTACWPKSRLPEYPIPNILHPPLGQLQTDLYIKK